MADGEVADPAQELTLRAQVEEASGADLAAALPSAHYFKWLRQPCCSQGEDLAALRGSGLRPAPAVTGGAGLPEGARLCRCPRGCARHGQVLSGLQEALGGSKASTCGNERAHSVSGRICSKLRGSLLPDTVERLTLAYYYMRREVEEQMRLWGEKALRNLELEDILEVEVAAE